MIEVKVNFGISDFRLKLILGFQISDSILIFLTILIYNAAGCVPAPRYAAGCVPAPRSAGAG